MQIVSFQVMFYHWLCLPAAFTRWSATITVFFSSVSRSQALLCVHWHTWSKNPEMLDCFVVLWKLWMDGFHINPIWLTKPGVLWLSNAFSSRERGSPRPVNQENGPWLSRVLQPRPINHRGALTLSGQQQGPVSQVSGIRFVQDSSNIYWGKFCNNTLCSSYMYLAYVNIAF